MLRRKLMMMLGSLLLLVVLAAISAIGLLHNVLDDLVAASAAAGRGTSETADLEATLARIDADLHAMRHDPAGTAPPLLAAEAAELERGARRLAAALPGDDAAPALDRLRSALDDVRGAAAGAGRGGGPERLESLLDAAAALHAAVTDLGHVARQGAAAEQDRLVRKFRLVGLAVGVVFLLLLNVSIVVLLRSASMILEPVDVLVDASRRLGREEFDHRVVVDRRDEFGELAAAYNSLAGQLDANEQRKIETLQQVACALNHELNNAISAVGLQLELLGRRSAGDRTLVEPLQRCQQTLARMGRTVDSLQHVRKIVLTDYRSGIKMLDLQRSVEASLDPPRAAAEGAPAAKTS